MARKRSGRTLWDVVRLVKSELVKSSRFMKEHYGSDDIRRPTTSEQEAAWESAKLQYLALIYGALLSLAKESKPNRKKKKVDKAGVRA